jgi:hypothetical protein
VRQKSGKKECKKESDVNSTACRSKYANVCCFNTIQKIFYVDIILHYFFVNRDVIQMCESIALKHKGTKRPNRRPKSD